ncbi:MAG: T9SS type A sorting domain-containing protein, partial [Bacteroidales bacterium]|nr:T9SS type A sorting domain-containing protein [Bacteroidales bacterium]
ESIITDYEANTITNLKLVLPFLNTGAEAFTYKIYPNPAKESATLIYFLPEKTEIDFTIYDITGKKLRTIVKEIKEAGNSSVVFDTSSLNPGVYFYTIKTNRKQKTGKLIIM